MVWKSTRMVITSLSDIEARAVAAAFAAGVKRVFFQFWSKIFAELIENTENFY